MNALNPVLRMEEQFCDVLLAHNPGMTRYEAIKRAQELLEIVDIHPSRLKDYPHQFSGGMRQRLVIAIAMALNPELLIMDEPTTALDVVVQREILQKVYALKAKFNFSILFITHDLSLMVEFCDRIGIMYAGELVEVAPAKAILTAPLHPYTKGLGNSFPPLHGPKTVLEDPRHPAQPAGGAGRLPLPGPLRQGARSLPSGIYRPRRDPARAAGRLPPL